MANAYFRLIDASVTPAAASASYQADPATGGPWSAELQHGGPPNALLVLAAEQRAAAETGRSDLRAMRLSAEFLRPVPVGEVAVSTQLLRAARTIVLVAAQLHAGGQLCLAARIWLLAVRSLELPERFGTPLAAGAEPAATLPGIGASFPYADSIEWRSEYGGLTSAGPARVWARPNRPIVADCPLSGLQRTVLVGDSASGVSAELDWMTWLFTNVDLDVHLAREPIGDWLLLDAVTTLGPDGAGLARSSVSDLSGPVGATAQTLVVDRRRR